MSLELVTEFQSIIRRDFKATSADAALLRPGTDQALENGQFVAQVAGANEVTIDGTGFSPTPANVSLTRQVFVERGRSDIQAISKITTLWSFPYEGLTNLYDGTITAGEPLTVDVGLSAGVNDLRLVLRTAVSGELAIGYAITGNSGAASLGSTNVRFVFTGPAYIIA